MNFAGADEDDVSGGKLPSFSFDGIARLAANKEDNFMKIVVMKGNGGGHRIMETKNAKGFRQVASLGGTDFCPHVVSAFHKRGAGNITCCHHGNTSAFIIAFFAISRAFFGIFLLRLSCYAVIAINNGGDDGVPVR